MAICARTSGDTFLITYEEYFDGITSFCTSNFYSLFCLFTFPWWAYPLHILWLHVHVPPLTYSVHMPPLAVLLLTYSVCMELSDCTFLHTTPQKDSFSISTNSSWPTLYTSNFYDLFRSLTCPLWDYFIEWCFLVTCAGTSGVRFCIHTSYLWPILYTRNFLMSYALYIFPHVLFCRNKIRNLCDLVFNLVTFMAYSVHVENCDFVDYFFFFARFSSHILWLTGSRTSVYLFCTGTSYLYL